MDTGSIIDFGCHGGSILAALPDALLALLLMIILAGGGSFAGSKRWMPADILTGWGLLAAFMTLAGIFLPGAMKLCTVIVLAIMALGIVVTVLRRKASWLAWLGLALVLQIWVLIAIDLAGIAGWDDIAQWTPNAFYFWRHNAFPALALPPSHSNRPAYPYALAYLTYAVALGRGAFVMQAGAMINWLLLAAFGWALTEFDEDKSRTAPRKFLRLLFAIALVTIFNPGFNASFSVTGQSDTATSVVVGFLFLLLLKLREAAMTADRRHQWTLALQLACIAVALTLLRDLNIILLAMLLGGYLLLALRDRQFIASLKLLTPTILGAGIFFVLWHEYAAQQITRDTPSPILPFAQWHWPLLPQFLKAVGKEMLKKNGFFVLMLGASMYGIRAFFKKTPNRLGDAATLAFILFAGYMAFIVVAFMGSTFFTEHNVVGAMSFYRYGTHTVLAGVAILWLLFERYLEPRIGTKGLAALGALSLLVLPAAFMIRPSALVPQPSIPLCSSRAYADALAVRLPPQTHLAMLDLGDNSFDIFITNMELAIDDLKTGRQAQITAYADPFDLDHLPTIMDKLKNSQDFNAVFIRQPTNEIRSFFDLKGDRPAWLLIRNIPEWQNVDLPASPTP